jgi:hypothetical protein
VPQPHTGKGGSRKACFETQIVVTDVGNDIGFECWAHSVGIQNLLGITPLKYYDLTFDEKQQYIAKFEGAKVHKRVLNVFCTCVHDYDFPFF